MFGVCAADTDGRRVRGVLVVGAGVTIRLDPFWRFYGGKHRAARRYPAPLHGRPIIEPFAGAAGYSTSWWEPGQRVILVERDPVVAAVWRYLLSASSAEILRLPNVREHVDVDLAGCPQEARWLAGFWLNEGGATPRKACTGWARARGDGGSIDCPSSWAGWGARARNRIARQVDAVRGTWAIIEGDYTAAPMVDATWFIDPPYQTSAGRYYKYATVDYAALGAWCDTLPGRVVACDQEGADWRPWTSRICLGATSRANRPNKVSREVVWARDNSRMPLFDGIGP